MVRRDDPTPGGVRSAEHRALHRSPYVEPAPLPAGAQFLNVIESVFSGMAKAIVHNSDYESVEACKAAIDRYFAERNAFFRANPKRAGRINWGKENAPSRFSDSNNDKSPRYQCFGLERSLRRYFVLPDSPRGW
jgi:hypothetical protein